MNVPLPHLLAVETRYACERDNQSLSFACMTCIFISAVSADMADRHDGIMAVTSFARLFHVAFCVSW